MQEILFLFNQKLKAHWQNQRGKRGGITRMRNPPSGVCLEFLIVFTLTKNQSGYYEVIRASFEFIKTPALRRGLCLRAAYQTIKKFDTMLNFGHFGGNNFL